jgi:hypothetical protein
LKERPGEGAIMLQGRCAMLTGKEAFTARSCS